VNRQQRTWCGASLLVLSAALSTGPAEASGFLAARFGADHGNPMTGNPFAVYFNPAALGGLQETQLTLDTSIAYRTVDYTRSERALSPSTTQPSGDPVYRDANTGRGRVSNLLASPFGGVASNLGTKWLAVGFASYIPFGGISEWDKNDKYSGSRTAPGAVDGPQRWHAMSGRAISWYNTVAAAVTIPSIRLSFGISASLISHSAASLRARNDDGSDDMRSQQGQLIEGRSILDVKGSGFGMAGGIYWEPKEDRSIRVGVSYTSRPNFGQMRLEGDVHSTFGKLEDEKKFKVDFLQNYPDIWRAGGAWRPRKDLEIRLDGEYVNWSVFRRQCIVVTGAKCYLTPEGAVNTDPGKSKGTDVIQVLPRDWKDAWGLRAGVSMWTNPETEVFLSGGFDTSAVPVERMDPLYMDSFKLLGTVGVRKQFTKSFALAGSYNHVYYLPVDTRGKNTLDTYKPPSKSPSADGTYESQIIFINVNATVMF
jgi:long-chain fatty acid transport protein